MHLHPALDQPLADRLAAMPMAGLHREYPNKVAHVFNSSNDAKTPHELTPAFYGCFDWHSAVHGHWCLVRLLKAFPESSWRDKAVAAIDLSLTEENIAAEVAYRSAPGRASFECPYGVAWLLTLAVELQNWDERGQQLAEILTPLEDLCVSHLMEWIARLPRPIRTGEHNQSAFSMGLAWDWAVATGRDDIRQQLTDAALRFHADDRAAPIHCEPSGHDFLSPALATADLMRSVLPAEAFTAWWDAFIPTPKSPEEQQRLESWLTPAYCSDHTDGKLAHLDGLNWSRAWMLSAIADALPNDHPMGSQLNTAAGSHRQSALTALDTSEYASTHWIASFAVYGLTSAIQK